MKKNIIHLAIASLSLGSLSMATQAASSAYVTDGYGNLVKDNYGQCVRTINWSAEQAIENCEVKAIQSDEAKNESTPAPSLLPAVELSLIHI